MTRQELQNLGCLVPIRLQDVLTAYPVTELSDGEQSLWEQICDLAEQNGREQTYFDFYYGTLSSDEQEKARLGSALTAEQLLYLNSLALSGDPEQVYFPYEERLFEIAFRMSVSDMLFSTFYFPKLGKTLWTSFGGKWLLIDGTSL